MASGRKNRGSRHRSHRHKQQKGDDSGDTYAEENLRHGPNPNPHPNSSSPWTMEPLPPNVEGPSVLKQQDMENVDRDSQHALQSSSSKRRKESLHVASVMDRWDGGAGADETASLSLFGVTERNSVMLGDGSRKESGGEIEVRNTKGKNRVTPSLSSSKGLERSDSNPTEISTHMVTMGDSSKDLIEVRLADGNLTELAAGLMSGLDGSQSAKSKVSRSSIKDKELENASCLANTSADMDRKHIRKNESSQKSKRSEVVANPMVLDSKDEHHNVFEKSLTGVFQGVVRNPELEKELESRIRRRSEGTEDRDRWREGSVKDREVKSSRFHMEEHHQTQMRLKDEKVWLQEKAKDDSSGKTRREKSSSRHRDEGWKAGQHVEEKLKEEGVMHVSVGHEGWSKHEKEHEQRRKSDRVREHPSMEVKVRDERQVLTSSKDVLKNTGKHKDLLKDVKDRDPDWHKENKTKDGRYKDDKARESKSKFEVSHVDDKRGTKEYANANKDQRLSAEVQQDDVRRDTDKPKEDRPKLKDRIGKLDDNLKDEREKHKEDEATYMKSKNERRRGEFEQEDGAWYNEDSGFDLMDGKGKKRFEREQDHHNTKYSKKLNEEGAMEKWQDEKDRGKKPKLETYTQRESQYMNGKEADSSAKYEVRDELGDRDGQSRDAWPSGERHGHEKGKDDASKHSKCRDESQERRWGGGIQDDRTKSSKEFFDRQKRSREVDDRQRYGLFNKRGDRIKEERKLTQNLMDNKHEEISVRVFERLGGASREASRRNEGGGKESRHNNIDKSYGQYMKKNKDIDGQRKPKGVRDSVDARESKGYSTSKGDRTVSKTARPTPLQDQERVLLVVGAKDSSTPESLAKRNLVSEGFAVGERDFARPPRSRLIEEPSSLLHEERPLHDKSVRKSKFEASVSNSSCTRRSREQTCQTLNYADQGKSYPILDEEVRSCEPRGTNQDSDDERRRPFSLDRIGEPLSPQESLAFGHEDFVRAPDSMRSKDAIFLKRKHDNFSQGAGPAKLRRVDDTSTERLDWPPLPGTQGNRPPPNRHVGSLALLPPPPPYRPGVDNPTVMGAPSNFVQVSGSRDIGRYDKKAGGGLSRRPEMVGPGDAWGGFGMGNWNTHTQGPVPGPSNLFASYPQMASGFMGMGQQFHVSQVFGPNGSRPVNMGFGGGRFRMGDGGGAFPGQASDHGLVMEWHRFSDRSEGHRPLSGFMHTWEGSGPYPDERQRFAHPEWDQFSQGLSAGGWDSVAEPWQGQIRDTHFDVHSSHHRQRDNMYQAQREDMSWSEAEAEKNTAVEASPLVETSEISHVCADDATEIHVTKGSKHSKERMHRLLLYADVCAELVDPHLFKEYLSLLPPPEAKKREDSLQNLVEVTTIFVDEDLEFEGDSEAQDLLLSKNPGATLLPTLAENTHKNALKIFQRPVRQNRLEKSLVGSFILPKGIPDTS